MEILKKIPKQLKKKFYGDSGLNSKKKIPMLFLMEISKEIPKEVAKGIPKEITKNIPNNI